MQKDKKRIAVFVNGGINAGAFNQGFPPVSNLIIALSKKHDITVYSLSKKNESNSHLKIKSIPGYLKKIKGLDNLYLILIFILDHFKCPYNIMHGIWGLPSGLFAVFLGKILNKRSIVTLMGGESAFVPEIKFGGLTSKKSRRLILWTCRNADHLVSISDFMRETLFEAELKRKKPFSTIILAANKLFVPLKREIKEDSFHIIHIANINAVKDQNTLIQAFKMLSERLPCQLHLVGGDYLNGKIHALVTKMKLDDKVIFHGEKKNTDIIPLLQKSDLLIHSSLSEGQAVVFCEAMACGIPVCSTHTGLMADLSGTHCLTSKPKDFEGLANNSYKILTNDKLRKSLIENGLSWTQKNNEDYTVDAYLKLYKSMC